MFTDLKLFIPNQRSSDHHTMVFFCFMVDQKRKVRRSRPAPGICARCGGGASVADMKTAVRFCHVPFYWKSWRALICTFCGSVLRSYR
ncbi:uncharacterized protein LOC101208066 [Cucumis sativus]|uniref:uncharacterized protein LOC101208066 n=1 Tax=Cucumis sativus TaxID=3659 RepID=UPI0012F4830A|nr:uncharacterized protein LOC101208066 [Cucumis sativus]